MRNVATINASYELPFGPQKHWLKNAGAVTRLVAAGWTTSAIVNLQSGFPFTPQLGYNPTGNGDTRNPIRPSWAPGYNGKLYPRTFSTEMYGTGRFSGGVSSYSGEYGPDSTLPQGGMSFEQGSRNQPPHNDLAKSAEIIGPAFVRSVRDVLDDLFWPKS